MRREFIGGRVPKMVKDAFVREAEAAGLTLTEHLEKVLLERMNEEQEDPAPSHSLDDLRQMIKEELSAQTTKETVAPEEDPLETAEPQRVGEEPSLEMEEEADLYVEDLEEEEESADVLPYPIENILNLAVLQTWVAACRTLWFIQYFTKQPMNLKKFRPWYRLKQHPTQLDIISAAQEAFFLQGISPVPRFIQHSHEMKPIQQNHGRDAA